ncbi:unnamed protein product [Closterium sp. NIES-64]|nr:unnamed protein product [Closterium sp. NIES-64]
MEGKIAARKDKEKAAEEAISSVSGKSAAGPKPKQGRMEDFYGDEGLSSKRNSDEVICLYFAGMRVAEWQCENLLFLNMLRAVATVPNYVPPKRDYVGGAKGMMGAIYDIMLQLTEDMAKLLDGDMCKLKEEEKEEVQEHLRRRWDESLACPLHVVGRILNSANQLEEIFLRDVECTKVMREWLARSKVFVDKFWKGKKGPHKRPSGVGRKGGIVEGNIPTPPLPEGYKLEEDGEVEEDEDAMCVDEHAHQEDGEEEEEGGEDED